MAKQRRLPKTGIEIVEGLPGSGKTYHAVKTLCENVLWERRPVYTNLPLRLRVVRRYLRIKGDDPILARYVQPLTEDHLKRFFERNAAMAKFRMAHKSHWGEPRIRAEFCKEHGPHVIDYDGDGEPNWFPPGAMIVIDEAHLWFDYRQQQREAPEILLYTSMHRHHMHRIILITQDKQQVSISWRRNAVEVLHAADKRRIPFLFGLRVPLMGFSYEVYPAEMGDMKDARVKPVREWVTWPRWGGMWVFRLYDSHTHMGSRRHLHKGLDDVRASIEGGERSREEETETQTEASDMGKRTAIKFWPALLVVVLLACIVTGCLWGGGDDEPDVPSEPVKGTTRDKPTGRPDYTPPGFPDFGPGVIGDGYVVIDGQVYEHGSNVRGFTLERTDNAKGLSFWRGGDGKLFALPAGMRKADPTSAVDRSESAFERFKRLRDATQNPRSP